MIAANHDRAFEFAGFHHLVESQAGQMPLTQADPANTRGQALKGDALLRHIQPAVQVFVVGEEFFHLCVCFADVLGVAAQCHPAEGANAFAEQRAHIRRHKTGEVKRIGHTKVFGYLAQVVAVIHGGDAHTVEGQHGADVGGAGFSSGAF